MDRPPAAGAHQDFERFRRACFRLGEGGNAHIAAARIPADLPALTQLFRAYAASLPIDLGYQSFDDELASLPGKYAPPAGALLIARDGDGPALGCVAMRPLEAPGVCEMKRLYIAPEGRGLGLGRALAEAIIVAARERGYREMRLDTMPSMTSAIALYRSLGFRDIPAYYDTPVTGNLFLSLALV
ncbi:MAG: GNAT family N-acetyltransferase [Hyphomonadaceae bacterium]